MMSAAALSRDGTADYAALIMSMTVLTLAIYQGDARHPRWQERMDRELTTRYGITPLQAAEGGREQIREAALRGAIGHLLDALREFPGKEPPGNKS